MPNLDPYDALAAELGELAGQIAREASLRIDAALSDIRRVAAEQELRFSNLERACADRLASLKDGEPGHSVTVEEVAPLIEAEIARKVAQIPTPKDGEPGKSVTVEDVESVISARVAGAIAAVELPALPDIGEMVRDAVSKIPGGLDGKDADMEALRSEIKASVSAAVAEIPVPRDGIDVDMEEVAGLVRSAVATVPPPRDGKDADPALVTAEVERVLSMWERPQDGRSVTAAELAPMVDEAVQRAVAAVPAPERGKDGADADPEIVRQMVREAVAEIPPAARGEPGPAGPSGKLPLVRAWGDGVHYEGAVVSHEGSTFQAARDTGRAPPHEDWILIAAGGSDGRSFSVKGTYTKSAEYEALDVVALNGASFVALRDAPGECPGADWQLLCMQGKAGRPGERGAPGPKGERGAPGPAVVKSTVDANGLQTTTNADGSTVTCDFYPVLASIKSA